MNTFDYIIIGAGASGLMLADALGRDPFFSNSRILILEKDNKENNDRTWCFWEQGPGDFDTLLFRSWNQIRFKGEKTRITTSIAPYTYKMIRGIDFYEAYLKKIKSYHNITLIQDTVTSVLETDKGVEVVCKQMTFYAKKVFNSLFSYKMTSHQKKYPVLQQHFIGWVVQTKKAVFKADIATFMDFSVPQKGNTRFMYVLPFSETKALVEYTLFSEKQLPQEEYEKAIDHYLTANLKCDTYQILDNEKGSIPMTCYPLGKHSTKNILYIGTGGGWAKPSTGYTFRNTVKKTKELIGFLKTNRPLHHFSKKGRFWFYDLLLLDILYRTNHKGRRIFEMLFTHRKPAEIFKFLDEETTFGEEIRVIFAAPFPEFIGALVRRVFGIRIKPKSHDQTI